MMWLKFVVLFVGDWFAPFVRSFFAGDFDGDMGKL